MSGGSLLRNRAARNGGGVFLGDIRALEVEGVDLGTGADDNAPGDVFAGDAEIAGYGELASFSCDEAGCTPTPRLQRGSWTR